MFKQIAIVAAMEAEMGFLRRAMTPADHSRNRCVMGTIGSKSITLLRSGVGPLKTARRLAETTALSENECVLSIGCAGALRPGIGVGDVVIPDRIVADAKEDPPYAPSQELINVAKNCCEESGFLFHSGTTVSASEVAATAEAKQKLASRHGAVAVDMETSKVAAWAHEAGVPFLAIRTVSDTASDRIPPETGMLVDEKGNFRPAKAVAVFARKPGVLFEAIRLKRNLDYCLRNLEKVVTLLLDRV